MSAWQTRNMQTRQHAPTATPVQRILACGHYSDDDDCHHPDCEGDTPDPWDLVNTDTYEADLRAERLKSIRRMTTKIWEEEVYDG